MQTFVALLRGINVGKSNRVPMADLRELLRAQGHGDVVTLLNSGNAVFRAASGTPAHHAEAISAAVLARFGLHIPVIVKAVDELSAIIKDNPLDLSQADPSQVLVAFVQEPADLAGLEPLMQLTAPNERFVIGQNAAYLHCANGILSSKVGRALTGKAGTATTTRNWATVVKLQGLANSNH